MGAELTDFGYYPVFVDSEELREQALRIRRECFAVEADADNATVQDNYDLLPNSHSYLLVDRDRNPVGTIRFCIYSEAFKWQPIPACDTYPDVLASIGPTTVVQSTYFSVLPAHQAPGLLMKLLLIREFIRTALSHRAAHAITIVRNTPTWIAFFKRLGFVPMGTPRTHPWAKREGVLIGASPLDVLASARANPRFSAAAAFDEAGLDNDGASQGRAKPETLRRP